MGNTLGRISAAINSKFRVRPPPAPPPPPPPPPSRIKVAVTGHGPRQVIQLVFAPNDTFNVLKQPVAKQLRISPDRLKFLHGDHPLPDNERILDHVKTNKETILCTVHQDSTRFVKTSKGRL